MIKYDILGFTHLTAHDMLDHINKKCLALNIREKEENFKETNIRCDLDDDIATYFIKLYHLEEELKREYKMKCPTTMKINRAVNEMSNRDQFEGMEIMDWEDKYDQDKRGYIAKVTSKIVYAE